MPELAPSNPTPRVAIVILTWNQAQMTLECLRSLQGLTYPCYDVILVDNASSDSTPDLVRAQFPAITVLENQANLGYSDGNNVGIRYALAQDYAYIFLLNNDTLVDPEMLTCLVEACEADPQAGIAGPTMFYAEPPSMLWGGENRIDWRRSLVVRKRMGELLDPDELVLRTPVESDYTDSCALLVKRQVLEKIGLMDGRYFINFDDLDLNLRARKAGYRVLYVPQARMWHRVSAAMGVGSPATTYYMTRNALLFFSRHAPGIWKGISSVLILARTARTVSAWTFKSEYHQDSFHRRRAANLLAVRDFFLGHFGRMGPDVAKVCSGK